MKLKALLGLLVVVGIAGCGAAPKLPTYQMPEKINKTISPAKTMTPTKPVTTPNPATAMCTWTPVDDGSTFTMNGMAVTVTLEEAVNMTGAYCGQVRSTAMLKAPVGSYMYNTSVQYMGVMYSIAPGTTTIMNGMMTVVGMPYTIGKVCGLMGQAQFQNAGGFTVTSQTGSLCVK